MPILILTQRIIFRLKNPLLWSIGLLETLIYILIVISLYKYFIYIKNISLFRILLFIGVLLLTARNVIMFIIIIYRDFTDFKDKKQIIEGAIRENVSIQNPNDPLYIAAAKIIFFHQCCGTQSEHYQNIPGEKIFFQNNFSQYCKNVKLREFQEKLKIKQRGSCWKTIINDIKIELIMLSVGLGIGILLMLLTWLFLYQNRLIFRKQFIIKRPLSLATADTLSITSSTSSTMTVTTVVKPRVSIKAIARQIPSSYATTLLPLATLVHSPSILQTAKFINKPLFMSSNAKMLQLIQPISDSKFPTLSNLQKTVLPRSQTIPESTKGRKFRNLYFTVCDDDD
ncbi:unnamed protein product [Didymodactylos carnosus]|uniref:Uncharacterized protein n=1 Tax=Didymodactylos carnosus TaxID=1234261 RepID=A0A814AY77_9BILA|nr:unnamed protein product [Didymodactylos carnosus]CAF1146768.1 unnamed protein product [Didymodactylos carnosus]CAF3699567.1 unnamed protein product [Didymodactylos carnosus]CAF3949017.1 unnamed protein product [Didymodactylos carnosus]